MTERKGGGNDPSIISGPAAVVQDPPGRPGETVLEFSFLTLDLLNDVQDGPNPLPIYADDINQRMIAFTVSVKETISGYQVPPLTSSVVLVPKQKPTM